VDGGESGYQAKPKETKTQKKTTPTQTKKIQKNKISILYRKMEAGTGGVYLRTFKKKSTQKGGE